jgi:hypothetical protein
MAQKQYQLSIIPGLYSVCRLSSWSTVPDWALSGKFYSITSTSDELSIVCDSDYIPEKLPREGHFKCFKIEEILDFSLVGVLASLTQTLAEVGISVFVISTYNTDYILVKENNLDIAVAALEKAGYTIIQ